MAKSLATKTAATDEWWSELDDQVLACLHDGPKSIRDVARRLGLSHGSVTSVLLMLAAEGKIRVTEVALAESA